MLQWCGVGKRAAPHVKPSCSEGSKSDKQEPPRPKERGQRKGETERQRKGETERHTHAQTDRHTHTHRGARTNAAKPYTHKRTSSPTPNHQVNSKHAQSLCFILLTPKKKQATGETLVV